MARIPHPSGVPNAYATDRADDAVVFPEDTFIAAMDLNDAARIARDKIERVAQMVARDGDILEGCKIISVRNPAPATTVTLTLAAGRVYADGDSRSVPARTITNVPGTGEVRIGIRLVSTRITDEQDATLVGPHPGTEAEGEPIAQRVVMTATWSRETAKEPGTYVNVYTLLDGVPLDQSSPELSNVTQIVASYDYSAHGHYVVSGCEVRALGRTSGKQRVAIAAGEANIQGFKRIRLSTLMFEYNEDPDLEEIDIEPHTYTASTGANNTITVNRPPIASVDEVVVTKRRTVDIVRGVTAGGSDALPDASIQAIETVTQGGTTFAAGTYTLSGANISWAPAGAEPAASSTYTVTYRYFDAQPVVSVTDTTIVVNGGVNGQPVFASYRSKLPRIDALCMNIDGEPVLVRGESARVNASPPQVPDTLLKLATLTNTWMPPAPYRPAVVNDGTRSMTFDYQRRLEALLLKVADYFDRAELERNALAYEPVSKRGIFTDGFVDDFRRDDGEPQTAAIVDGNLCLAVDAVDAIVVNQSSWITLPWTEQIIIRQDQQTSGMLINPYANFTRMPAGMILNPPVDFFTTHETVWTSPETRVFQALPGQPPSTITITEEVSEARRPAQFLRPLIIGFQIEGFGAGERLDRIALFRPDTTGGTDIVLMSPPGVLTPVPVDYEDYPPANINGGLMGRFQFPPTIPAGPWAVRAFGQAGSIAQAIFIGRGTVETRTLRRVTLVARAAPPINPTVPQPVVPRPPWGNQNPIIRDTDEDPLWPRSDGRNDPLAQTFAMPNGQGRMIVGVNLWVHAIGDRSRGIRVQLVTVENGLPTTDVMAEDFISMGSLSIQPGSMIQARFRTPVYCEGNRQHAFVIMTDDNLHALKVCKLGDVYDLPDDAGQARVGRQSYANGVLLASADRLTWTPVQEADLAFQVVAANFSATTLTETLWTGPLDRITDLVVRSGIELPEQGANVRFELVRASGQVQRFVEGQRLEFPAYVGPSGSPETVTLRAVLTGNARVSPVIFPGTILLTGRIREEGNYVTKVFEMGASVTLRTLINRRLPAGSTLTIEADAGDDDWKPVAFSSQTVLGNGWTEGIYSRTSHAAANGGRIRIVITGGPGARPFLSKLRAYSI